MHSNPPNRYVKKPECPTRKNGRSLKGWPTLKGGDEWRWGVRGRSAQTQMAFSIEEAPLGSTGFFTLASLVSHILGILFRRKVFPSREGLYGRSLGRCNCLLGRGLVLVACLDLCRFLLLLRVLVLSVPWLPPLSIGVME
jgi:hypothetical protein